MNRLWLTSAQAAAIVVHARAEAPREACGLIAGRGEQAVEVIPARNVANEPEDFYTVDPAALSQHLPRLEKAGLSLIGLYHSHPDGDPIPSPTDIAEATYPNTAYLIVGLRGEHPQFAAWLIHHGEVQRIDVHVSDTAPDDSIETRLSTAQRFAVVIGALLAFFVLIWVALVLLPPAPVLTTP